MYVAVDEAHCVKVWGAEFRPQFREIEELRSIILSGVNIMALTATATIETFHTVVQQLSMCKPVLVGMPPNRGNIMFQRLTSGLHSRELEVLPQDCYICEAIL